MDKSLRLQQSPLIPGRTSYVYADDLGFNYTSSNHTAPSG